MEEKEFPSLSGDDGEKQRLIANGTIIGRCGNGDVIVHTGDGASHVMSEMAYRAARGLATPEQVAKSDAVRATDEASKKWHWEMMQRRRLAEETLVKHLEATTQENLQAGQNAVDDESAYILISKLDWSETECTTYRQRRKFLNEHPAIKTRHLGPQRFGVHAGDWLNYWANKNEEDFAKADGEAERISPKMIEGISDRTAEIDKRRNRPARNL